MNSPVAPTDKWATSRAAKTARAWSSGDFSLIGFSSDEAVANASNGSFTMVKGKVFGYDASSDGDAIISKSLADRS